MKSRLNHDAKAKNLDKAMDNSGQSNTKPPLKKRELRKIWTYYLIKKVGFLLRIRKKRKQTRYELFNYPGA